MNSHQEPHIKMEIAQKTDHKNGAKGYIVNQGGRNAFSGFRGRHKHLANKIKAPEAEVKPNNTLEDEKSNSPEYIEKESEQEDSVYSKPIKKVYEPNM